MKIISDLLFFPSVQYTSRMTFLDGYNYYSPYSKYKIKAPQSIHILSINNVAIVGIGFIVEITNWIPIFKFEDQDLSLFPSWIEPHFFEGKFRQIIYEPFKKKKNELKPIKVDSVITAVHCNCNGYGHFLLEILPKIFVLKDFFDKNKGQKNPPIAMPSSLKPWVKHYILEVWPECSFLWFNPLEDYIVAESTFVVTGGDMITHPNIANYFLKFAEIDTSIAWNKEYNFKGMKQFFRFGNIFNFKNKGRKFFLSRPKKYTKNQILNIANLEKIATSKGYKVIEPSKFGSLKKQALFLINVQL